MPPRKQIVPFGEVLKNLLAWFKSTSTKGMIIGGVAQSLMAQPRATQDIDALILVDHRQLEELFRKAGKFGFVSRLANALEFAKTNRVLLMRHTATRIDVDISLAGLAFEEESFKRMIRVKAGNMTIPLPSPEDLIIMKAVAHRPKDLIDIESIIESHRKIDFARVKKWVEEFADALETPEIYSDLLTLIGKTL